MAALLRVERPLVEPLRRQAGSYAILALADTIAEYYAVLLTHNLHIRNEIKF